MRISTFIYTVKQGVINIWHNKLFSLASVATMSACIFLFGLFYAIVMNFQSIVKDAQAGVTVTVFFVENVSQEQIDHIGIEIDKRSEVARKKFVSAQEALEDFSEKYFKGAEELVDGFKEDNPLADSEHYEVYLNDVADQATLVTYLESLDGVRSVQRFDAAANTLVDFNKLMGYISAGIILILLCVAVFLISNTVTVGIAVRKEEIAIMKLIGATDYFVRAPFMVEGILIGFVGSMIPLGILYVLYNKIITYIGERFLFLNDILSFLPVKSVFSTLMPVGLLLGVGIGFLGSLLTIRKHLKV